MEKSTRQLSSAAMPGAIVGQFQPLGALGASDSLSQV
jgi:hypothetical protein